MTTHAYIDASRRRTTNGHLCPMVAVTVPGELRVALERDLRALVLRPQGAPSLTAITRVLVLVLILSACRSGLGPGPLQRDEGGAWGWSHIGEVGDVFTDGSILLKVPDGVEVTLVSVEPVMEGAGLKVLGAHVAGPEREAGFIQRIDSWPPTDPLLPVPTREVAGTTIVGDHSRTYGDAWLLFVGYEVSEEGRTTVQGNRVAYLHDGKRYQVAIASTLAVCVGEQALDTEGECEPEYDTVHGRF